MGSLTRLLFDTNDRSPDVPLSPFFDEGKAEIIHSLFEVGPAASAGGDMHETK
jgi:hypothetical protein